MSRVVSFVALTLASALALPVLAADITVDVGQGRVAVSPYIWGVNQDMPGGENVTARRLGGNRLTGYNWENNASNAGSDYQMSSDSYLTTGFPAADVSKPGSVLTHFHDASLTQGTVSLITLPMAGYVAADKNGTVAATEVAPSARWDEVKWTKGSAFTATPDLTDGVVYLDEEVAFLVGQYGAAGTARGVPFYAADNEPDIWSSTHPRIHPNKITCVELVTRTVAFAKAVKAVDPQAQVFGFVSYGWSGYKTLQSATDWNTVKGSYDWFISYFLAEMKKASDAAGIRLLDALDLHWYPEATGGGTRITTGDTVNSDARVQAPRSLWDPTYSETSWICPGSCPIALLPHVQQSIDTYYPGTKLAITEYSWGAPDHVSGGVALADVFGIFAKYGIFFATQWGNAGTYSSVGFKIYRNYDGANSTWGNVEVKADTTDVSNVPVHAAVEGSGTSTLHLMLINRNATLPQTANVTITSPCSYTAGRVWGFGPASAAINERAAITAISGNTFAHNIDAMTVEHIVLTGSGAGCDITVDAGSAPGSGGSSGNGGSVGGGGQTGAGGATGAASEGGAMANVGASTASSTGCSCRILDARSSPRILFVVAALMLAFAARRRSRR